MAEEQKKQPIAWDMMTQTPGVKVPLAYTAPMTLPDFHGMSQNGGSAQEVINASKPTKGK